MSDYIKYMYREYLEGRTRIKKVNEDQPLFPNTGAGLLIQKNKLTDDWTALNVSDGHYEEESFNHEALAAAFLQGANMGQLRMLNEILDRARLNGPYCLENVADALLSFAPACKAESLIEKTFLHFIELSKSFSKNGGIYDPVHGIYIESKVNGMGDVPHFTLYDVSVADIEECMAWGIKHLDEVPRQIHVVNGSPHIATIYVTGPDDRRIYDLIYTLCEDGRWCDVSELNAETLARFNEVIAKANRIEAGIVKDDEWRDGMVEQVSGFMDKIKDMDAEEAEGADTVLAETFNSKTLARNSSTSISDVEFFRNQGTQKRTSRASAESKTQSARATGKDNIIQFAPRQNGKDIPSSKGTSLASKSQKYVAMANALNAASKSYVYRNEVAR